MREEQSENKMKRIGEYKYHVVKFLENPFKETEGVSCEYVCVPKSWVTWCSPEDGIVRVWYPTQEPWNTENKVRKREKKSEQWESFLSVLKYSTDIYEEAKMFIQNTKYSKKNNNEDHSPLCAKVDGRPCKTTSSAITNDATVENILDAANTITLKSKAPTGSDKTTYEKRSRVNEPGESADEVAGPSSQAFKSQTLSNKGSNETPVAKSNNSNSAVKKQIINQNASKASHSSDPKPVVQLPILTTSSAITNDATVENILDPVGRNISSKSANTITLKRKDPADSDKTTHEKRSRVNEPGESADEAVGPCSQAFKSQTFSNKVSNETPVKKQIVNQNASKANHSSDLKPVVKLPILTKCWELIQEVQKCLVDPTVRDMINKRMNTDNSQSVLTDVSTASTTCDAAVQTSKPNEEKRNVEHTEDNDSEEDDDCGDDDDDESDTDYSRKSVSNNTIAFASSDTTVQAAKLNEEKKKEKQTEENYSDNDNCDDDDYDDLNNIDAPNTEQKSQRQPKTFVLPPEYDANDSRWTLKYREPAPGLVELVKNSGSAGSAVGSGGGVPEENLYGGCEGPNAMYVKLISSDGHEFIVKREHALISGTIKAMLSGPGQFAANEANEVNFREIPSHVLQKVCMYFAYKMHYTNSSTELPEFPIAPELAPDLVMVANFLDC